jgi:hypothetical protein
MPHIFFSIIVVHGFSVLMADFQNQVKYVDDQNVDMECVTNLTAPVTWWFNDSAKDKRIEIYADKKVRNGFAKRLRVNTSKPQHYDLVIYNTTRDVAGRYECFENNGFGDLAYSVELTVLESKPICSVNNNTTNDSYVITCSFSFWGNIEPAFQWTIDDKKTQSGVTNITNNTATSSTAVTSKSDSSVTWSLWFKSEQCKTTEDKCVFTSGTVPLYSLETSADKMISGQSQDSSLTTMIIVICVVVGWLVLLILGITIFFALKNHRRKFTDTNSEENKVSDSPKDPAIYETASSSQLCR